MKSKILEQITIDREILSTFPKTNKKNNTIYIEEVIKINDKYNDAYEKVMSELKRRYGKFLTFKDVPELPILKKEIVSLEYKATLLDEYNTSFEKSGLDKLIYDISKYYKGNLEKVNTDLSFAIKLFKKAGVELTSESFTYSKYAKEYMDHFFIEIDNPSSSKLKEEFEKIYWKCPNLIKYIQLNLRKLYLANIVSFDKYIEEEKARYFDSNVSFNEIANEYRFKKNEYNTLVNTSEYLFLKKFENKELEINDYISKKVTDLFKQYSEFYDDSICQAIIKFNATVMEFKKFEQYKYIFEDIKNIYGEKGKEKKPVTSKDKLKQIAKLELDLEGGKKGLFSKLKKKSIDEDKVLDELVNLYNEFDDLIFKEKVFTIVNAGSKIIDLFNLAGSYFIYVARLLKKREPEILDSTIYSIFDDLRNFLLSFDHTLITNLNAFENYDIAMIVSDKYKLDNLNISIDTLKPENFDNLINQTNMLINYYNLSNLKMLSISEIDEYLKIGKKIEVELKK